MKSFLDNIHISSSPATARSTVSWCLMLTTDRQWLPSTACFSTSVVAILRIFQKNVQRLHRSPFQCLRFRPHSTRLGVFLSVHHSQQKEWPSERYSHGSVARPGRCNWAILLSSHLCRSLNWGVLEPFFILFVKKFFSSTNYLLTEKFSIPTMVGWLGFFSAFASSQFCDVVQQGPPMLYQSNANLIIFSIRFLLVYLGVYFFTLDRYA